MENPKKKVYELLPQRKNQKNCPIYAKLAFSNGKILLDSNESFGSQPGGIKGANQSRIHSRYPPFLVICFQSWNAGRLFGR